MRGGALERMIHWWRIVKWCVILKFVAQSSSLIFEFATNVSCIFDIPPRMKLVPLMHFVYIKRVSGEYQCGDEPGLEDHHQGQLVAQIEYKKQCTITQHLVWHL